jgi:arylsulfatase A-like enzyme
LSSAPTFGAGRGFKAHQTADREGTHVALLVSHPDVAEQAVNATVATTQIAPTILKLLGIDRDELDGVRAEGTPVLPGLE